MTSERTTRFLIDALATQLPREQVVADLDVCADYAIQGVAPVCVVAPGSLEELMAVMRVAQEQQAAIVPWGGGTQQSIAGPPERMDVVVRMERLARVLIHEPGDLTISVEAGMTMGALRAYLAPHGQMLPIDPPLPGRATIGGLIATGSDGARRLGYGTLRDLLIGITVVEVGGRVSKGGGMVVKNVSGFDMMKLYLASFGTLAVIAIANFKLLPIPRASSSLVCHFDRAAAAFGALEGIQLTQLTPTAAEYLNSAALGALGREGGCALALRAEGLPAAVERHMVDMRGLAMRHGASDAQRLDREQEEALWSGIADLSQTAALAGDEALLKLTSLPAEVDLVIGQIEALANRAGIGLAVNARALNGVIYARLRPVDAAWLCRALTELPSIQWIATTLLDAPHWGAQPPGVELMQRIKREFDPPGLLNPGRYVVSG